MFLKGVEKEAQRMGFEPTLVLAGRWHLSQFVDSPDPRFREIVHLFAEAGFLESEKDEFRAGAV